MSCYLHRESLLLYTELVILGVCFLYPQWLCDVLYIPLGAECSWVLSITEPTVCVPIGCKQFFLFRCLSLPWHCACDRGLMVLPCVDIWLSEALPWLHRLPPFVVCEMMLAILLGLCVVCVLFC